MINSDNYVPVVMTIQEHYEKEKNQFNVKRPFLFHNEEEIQHISELKYLTAINTDHRTWATTKVIMEHESWLMKFWKHYGLPHLLLSKNGLYGMRNIYGDVILKPVYNEIKPDYNQIELFCHCDFIVRKNNKWGVVWNDGTTRIPFEYDDIFRYDINRFVIRKGGKYGVIQENRGKINTLVGCRMDAVMHHDVMEGLIVFRKEGLFGWYGCQFPENNSGAEWNVVLIPTVEYFCSDTYDEDTDTFAATKDGQNEIIEYWTNK